MIIKIATYNIHKGVQGIGRGSRLEIHNIANAIKELNADITCLQEVRGFNKKLERKFHNWPNQTQADYLAPKGSKAIYKTNAITKHGEHGNALITKFTIKNHWHEDMSDHKFEQRGLLHVELEAQNKTIHVIVVHLGLLPASRIRQAAQLRRYIAREINHKAPLIVAGDFNDWGTKVKQLMSVDSLKSIEGKNTKTYPARYPIVQLDHIYTRGITAKSLTIPNGEKWHKMSDHLPLIAEIEI